RPDVDRIDDRSDLREYPRLRVLLRRNEREDRFDLRHRVERLERCRPLPKLIERAGGREREEARAAGRAEDALLPRHRLGAPRLQVEKVVIEVDTSEREQRQCAGDDGEPDDEPGMAPELRDEPDRPRLRLTSPFDTPPPREEHDGGKKR